MKRILSAFQEVGAKLIINICVFLSYIEDAIETEEMKKIGYKFKKVPGLKDVYAIESPTISDLNKAKERLDRKFRFGFIFIIVIIVLIVINLTIFLL